MADLRITVISTGYATPPEARRQHLESMQRQIRPPHGPAFDHVHLDGAAGSEWPDHFAHLVDVVGKLPDDRIVACVDADDWLGPPNALATVARYHAGGALVTYGSFRFADGRRGCPSEGYGVSEDVRRAPWRATHLKTFRAGLFKRIEHADLRGADDGGWLEHARDLALMFPLLEMAGWERSVHVREELYVYNLATSTEFRGNADTKAAELECVKLVRGRKPYGRLP